MAVTGIIFDAYQYQRQRRIKKLTSVSARTLGASLLSLTLIGFLFLYGPILEQELRYHFQRSQQTTVSVNRFGLLLQEIEAERIEAVKQEAESLGLDSSFSIYIPKIEAKSRIIANVDSSNKEEYLQSLKKGIAHAQGTYFPGQGQRIFLFAHSTNSPLTVNQYNAVFYLLNKLEPGDEITVFFADQKYQYQVREKKITSPEDTSWITGQGTGEELILQTCYPPGTTFERLLIVAQPK